MSALANPSEREVKIRVILDDLVRQRRRLESTAMERGLLEANRLGIVYWDWQLSRCLAEERAHGDAAA
jgi:hypothetical protein